MPSKPVVCLSLRHSVVTQHPIKDVTTRQEGISLKKKNKNVTFLVVRNKIQVT